MTNKNLMNKIFKRDINVLHAYNSILNDHLNKIKFETKKQYKEEQKQQYQFITNLLTKGLTCRSFVIQSHPKKDVYIFNNKIIFKSYIFKNITKNLTLNITTSDHMEYREKIYTTNIELQSDFKSINVSYNSKECINLFKFITNYIFKNNLSYLLTDIEKQVYLFNYISENTDAKKFIWRKIKSNKSDQLNFRTNDNKYRFVYCEKSNTGIFSINNDKNISYKFNKQDSDTLKNVIENSINSKNLDTILLNLNCNTNSTSLSNQNFYLES